MCSFLNFHDKSRRFLIPRPILQFTVIIIVLYCDVTFFLLSLKFKPFSMDKELYRYALCLPRLPDSPPRPDTPPGHVSWRDDDLELSCFSSNSEGSAVVDLTLPQPKKLTTRNLKVAICTYSKENGHLQLLNFHHNFCNYSSASGSWLLPIWCCFWESCPDEKLEDIW